MAKTTTPKRDPRIKSVSEVEALLPKEKQEFREAHGTTITDEALAQMFPAGSDEADK